MALPYDIQRDPYHCPDHFVLERTRPGMLAAWTFGLLLLVIGLGLLGDRFRSVQDGAHPPASTASSTLRS